jgi:N-methylhydantoinase A
VKAIETKLAKPLKLGLYEASNGVVQVVNVKMAEAIRAISTQRGYDLRDFAMIAFGGAGPVHSGQLALDLGIPTVIVPPYAGVNSAQGLMMCPVLHDYVVSRLRGMLEVDPAEVHQLLAGLADRAKKELKEEGFADRDIAINYFLDLRYAGQGYELTVPIDRPDLNRAALAETRKRFDVIHEQLTGHGAPDQAVEIVNYRVTGTGKVEMFDLPRYPAANTDVAVAKTGVRPMFFAALGSKPVDCAVYDRAKLGPGHKLNGPAVIEQFDATVVVHPEQQCRVDALNNLLIERKENGHGH